MPEQNHRISWDADSMIRNAKALQRVVKELEKNRPKPSDWRGKWTRGVDRRPTEAIFFMCQQ